MYKGERKVRKGRGRKMHIHSYPFPSLSIPHYYSNPQFPKPFPRITTLNKPHSTPPSSSSSQFHSSSSKEPNLELLLKPSPPSPSPHDDEYEEDDVIISPEDEEALAPFLKFFKSPSPQTPPEQTTLTLTTRNDENTPLVYYDPKPGDFAVGVVVSGNENKMDVSIGADFLATMLTKEALPMYAAEMESLVCGGAGGGARGMGRMGVVMEEEEEEEVRVSGRPVVEAGTVVFAEVLGRTLSGRPLLSCRRLYRRVAWHRVRQVLL